MKNGKVTVLRLVEEGEEEEKEEEEEEEEVEEGECGRAEPGRRAGPRQRRAAHLDSSAVPTHCKRAAACLSRTPLVLLSLGPPPPPRDAWRHEPGERRLRAV